LMIKASLPTILQTISLFLTTYFSEDIMRLLL
jgi:hypothetical protein